MAKEENKKELLTWDQICNILRLKFYDRKVVEIKYSDQSLLLDDWKKMLKKDGINF